MTSMPVLGQAKSSQEAWERASGVIPGGVSRDQLFVQPPFFASRGEGAYLFDLAGLRHIDFVNNYTSLIHGHAHGPTVAAISDQASRGTAFGAPSELEAQLAQEILRRLPSGDMVRFTNSGTEATMLALQLARHSNGRQRIAKFEGGYHGSHELVKISVKPEKGERREQPEPVAEEGAEGFDFTDVLPFDDLASVRRISEAQGTSWAALIVEPMQGSAGMLPAPTGLLAMCRELADRYAFTLVFDEVMTLRHGGHGLQSEWHVQPDLTTIGKIIGGGLAVGAVVGRVDAMQALAPPAAARIHHSGTFNGNPLTMAAGLASLADYDPSAAARLDSRGDVLRTRLQQNLGPLGLSVTGWGSMMNVHATPTPPRCWWDVRDSRRQRMNRIHARLLQLGVFVAPRGMICLSTAHSDAHLEELEAALIRAATEIEE